MLFSGVCLLTNKRPSVLKVNISVFQRHSFYLGQPIESSINAVVEILTCLVNGYQLDLIASNLQRKGACKQIPLRMLARTSPCVMRV